MPAHYYNMGFGEKTIIKAFIRKESEEFYKISKNKNIFPTLNIKQEEVRQWQMIKLQRQSFAFEGDEITKPLQNVQKELNNVNKMSSQTSKALNQLQRLKPIILAIKDKTSPVIEKVKKILQKVTGKHWNTIIKAKDMATKVIS